MDLNAKVPPPGCLNLRLKLAVPTLGTVGVV